LVNLGDHSEPHRVVALFDKLCPTLRYEMDRRANTGLHRADILQNRHRPRALASGTPGRTGCLVKKNTMLRIRIFGTAKEWGHVTADRPSKGNFGAQRLVWSRLSIDGPIDPFIIGCGEAVKWRCLSAFQLPLAPGPGRAIVRWLAVRPPPEAGGKQQLTQALI
jgi:hypothetical protein